MTYLMLLSAILGGLEGVYRYLQKSVMLVPLARRIGMKETFIYSEIVATTYIYRISILSPQDFPPRAQVRRIQPLFSSTKCIGSFDCCCGVVLATKLCVTIVKAGEASAWVLGRYEVFIFKNIIKVFLYRSHQLLFHLLYNSINR